MSNPFENEDRLHQLESVVSPIKLSDRRMTDNQCDDDIIDSYVMKQSKDKQYLPFSAHLINRKVFISPFKKKEETNARNINNQKIEFKYQTDEKKY